MADKISQFGKAFKKSAKVAFPKGTSTAFKGAAMRHLKAGGTVRGAQQKGVAADRGARTDGRRAAQRSARTSPDRRMASRRGDSSSPS